MSSMGETGCSYAIITCGCWRCQVFGIFCLHLVGNVAKQVWLGWVPKGVQTGGLLRGGGGGGD